jgi:hypothetical protein
VALQGNPIGVLANRVSPKEKAAEAFVRPDGLPITLPLAHPEGIERRLIDRRRRGEPVIGLIGGKRLPGQRTK